VKDIACAQNAKPELCINRVFLASTCGVQNARQKCCAKIPIITKLYWKKTKNRMKIAIPTDDRLNIAKRTGRCREFLIATVSQNAVISETIVPNAHTHDHDHDNADEHEHTHPEVLALLSNVEWLIVSAIGKYMQSDMENAGIQIYHTKLKSIPDILESLIKDFH